MKDYEQQDCQLFNTGRFNDIVYAYFVMAARQAKLPKENMVPLLAALEDVLNSNTASFVLRLKIFKDAQDIFTILIFIMYSIHILFD